MDRKSELKSYLKELSKKVFEAGPSEEELEVNRREATEVVREILDIAAQDNRGDILRGAGISDEGAREHFAKKGIIFRKIER